MNHTKPVMSVERVPSGVGQATTEISIELIIVNEGCNSLAHSAGSSVAQAWQFRRLRKMTTSRHCLPLGSSMVRCLPSDERTVSEPASDFELDSGLRSERENGAESNVRGCATIERARIQFHFDDDAERVWDDFCLSDL